MYSYKGKTALVTGASSGIGEAFARALAARGMHLVLVARSEDKLRTLANQLAEQHNIRAEVIVADLSQPEVTQAIFQTTQERGLAIDLLINNAGFSTYGNFETISAMTEQAEIMVNVAALVDLTHAYIPAMLAKGGGGIINVGSVGSFTPLAKQAVYTASKAFVLSFSEALHVEYRKRNIQVLALCPGAVATGFGDVINVDIAIKADAPDWVVQKGLKAFEQGRPFVIPGSFNYIFGAVLSRILPRALFVWAVSALSNQVIKPRSKAPLSAPK